MSGAVADDDWVKAAMTDDTVVVEILVRLQHHAPPPPRPKPAAFPLEWTVRQRRSKSVVSVNHNSKKSAHRASPTTPLSWSGATSFSGGSPEESSRTVPLRSKVNVDGEKGISKRSRKKKTLAELKDNENILLKERRVLKREMAALRLNLERERVANENLKRIKIELQPRLASESISGLPQHELTASHPTTIVSGKDGLLPPNENASESKFMLPDLNVMFNEPSSSDVICGIS